MVDEILDKRTFVKAKATWSIDYKSRPINLSCGKVSLDLRKREVLPLKVSYSSLSESFSNLKNFRGDRSYRFGRSSCLSVK